MEGMVGGSPADTRRATRVRKVAPKVAAVIIDRGTRQRVQINLLASVAVDQSFRVAIRDTFFSPGTRRLDWWNVGGLHIYFCFHTYIYTQPCTHIPHKHLYIHACTHAFIYIAIHTYIRTYILTFIACIHTCMKHFVVNTYELTYIHTTWQMDTNYLISIFLTDSVASSSGCCGSTGGPWKRQCRFRHRWWWWGWWSICHRSRRW